MIAEAFLSAFLQVIFQNIAASLLDELHLIHESKEELRTLTEEFLMLHAYLRDAAQKQQTNEAVGLWLGNLQDVAYDANNLLDECAFEAQRQKVIRLARVRDSISLINPMRSLFLHNISRKVRNMKARIEVIKNQRHYYGLEPERATNKSNAVNESTSLLEAPFVLEREGDERKIIDLLLGSTVADESNTSVVCIVGIGGVGKTTLAQRVFSDELVNQKFTVRSWVYVSQDFKEDKLTKDISKSIDGLSQDSASLDHLQKELLNKLREKRYLLVLDDVWIEDWRQWQKFRIPLLQGSRGSIILVTTRSFDVAEAMGPSIIHPLQPLGDDDCWCLFSQYYMVQFSNHMAQQISTDDLSELEGLSVEIAQKCNGLPSAAADLAFRFRQEPDKRRWRSILQSERIESSFQNSDSSRDDGRSYQLLPAHLKPCFAFCSVFPKGFEFEKEELVQLWMAQNFIQPFDDQRMEDVGSKYFDILERRLLLLYSGFDQKSNRPKHVMHESIHNYARYASRGCCSIGEPGKKTRHLSLMDQEAATYLNTASFTDQLRKLYTFVVFANSMTELPDDFTKKLRSLRALDLSNTNLQKLPNSIDCMKHLRYLQLKGTKIRMLPDAMCSLYFLQTLGLRSCYFLEKLPKDIKYLQNLRHIDLKWDEDSMIMATRGDWSRPPLRRRFSLRFMPPEIGLLTQLQTLSTFVVDDKSECGLGELQNLNHLHGELLVSNLHIVRHAEEARLANLKRKQHLQHLELHWDGVEWKTPKLYQSFYRRENVECILSELQPHSNLKGLRIAGYMGTSFPDWIWSSLLNLTSLTLINCRQCPSLPPLGNLPLLTELHIEGMDAVQILSCAFCGQGNPMPFRALKKLCLENMPNLKQWCGDKKCALRSLRELVIRHCSNLQEISHTILSLEKLVIEGSSRWAGLPTFPSLTSLHSLCLKGLAAKSLPAGLLRGFNSLKRLEISSCAELEGFPEDWPPTSLVYFGVKHCPVLRLLPNGLEKLRFLEDMEIENCPWLSSLPDEVGLLKTLVRLEISDCPWLLYLPSSFPVSLHILSISKCHWLKERCKRGGEDWTKIKDISSVWIDGEMVISPLPKGESSES